MYRGCTEIALTMPRRLGERGGEDLYAAGPLLARQLGASSSKDLAWLSRKSIIFPTISMESFEDSPDANRHGGTSIPRELVAKEWRSRLLHPRTRPLDRKSTRLNSSHANISYAVFCLKK